MDTDYDKPNILLLDDNTHNLDLLASIVCDELFSKSLVKTGEAAIKVAERIAFALAVLDINLPDINGLEVAHTIRSLQPECEIIFCSAYSDRETREKAFNAGGIDYIEKPFDMATAKQRIKNQTDRILLQKSLQLEKARLEKMVSSMADAVVTTDLEDRIVSFNSAAENIFKVPAEVVLNTKFSQFVPPALREQHSEALRNFKNGKSVGIVGRRKPTQLIALTASGERINVELILSSWTDNQSKFVTAIIRDTSEQKVVEASLAELSNALNGTESMVARFSKTASNYIWMTDKFASLIKHEHAKKNISALLLKGFNELESVGRVEQIREIEIISADNSVASYLIQVLPAKNSNELVIFVTETSTLTSLRRQASLLLDHVRTDELTGCLSRRAFLDDLENGKRSSDFVLALLDIDFFKSINDYYGHEVGDLFLIKLIEHLKANLSKNVVLARLGGEEFVLALPVTSQENEESYLQIIRQKIAKFKLVAGGRSISRSVSIGAARLRRDEDMKKVLANADEALQLAKMAGRNRVVYFNEDGANGEFRRVGRPSLEAIKTAFKFGEIYFDYQEVFDIFAKKIVGYEALIRMRDQNHRIVPPNYFVDEYYHLSNNEAENMSRAMLFRHYIDRIRGKEIGWVSYNVRGSDLIGKNCSELIEFCSPQNCGVQVCLELSEEEISERIDLPGLRQTLEMLKDHGFKIYLDDFGKERSNFHRLIELPFDVVKLDRVLIQSLGVAKKSEKLISFLTGLTSEFGMLLIAEGVETELQAKVLLENNLNLHQGFLYGRPTQFLAG